jgi:hypothetical protein
MNIVGLVRPLLHEHETIEEVIPVRHERPFEPRGLMIIFRDVEPTGALVITPNRIMVAELYNAGTKRKPSYEPTLEYEFPRATAIRFERQNALQRFDAWLNSYHGQ